MLMKSISKVAGTLSQLPSYPSIVDTLGLHLFACSTEVSLLIGNNALRGSKFFVLSLEAPLIWEVL